MKMRPSLLAVKKAKAALPPILSKFTRTRWNLACVTESGAYQAIRSTRSGNDTDHLGQADRMWIVPLTTPTSRVLDVGCEAGRVEKFLASHCDSIEAVDLSDRMVSIASRRLKTVANVRLSRMNATGLHIFSDETFDFCFSFHCLHDMKKEDAYLCLREILRVLKKSGPSCLHFPDFTPETYFS